MEHDFTAMSFARMRDADVRYIQRVSVDKAGRVRLLHMLNEYIRFLGGGKSPDDEKLFVLGRELRTVWPREFIQELENSVQKNVDSKVAEVFLAGLGDVEHSSSVSSVPSKREFDKFLSQIERNSFSSMEKRIKDVCQQHLSYLEHSGDTRLLPPVFFQIGEAILRRPQVTQSAANLVRDLALTALRWEPWNSRFWSLWVRSYLAQGAIEAAELILWEAIRRIPSNEYARTQLVGLLERFSDRRWEAIELARETAAIDRNNELTQNVLARVLLNSDDLKNHVEGIDLLIRRLRQSPSCYAHFSLLGRKMASISSDANTFKYYREIIARLPVDAALLNKIVRVMSSQSVQTENIESFLRASVSLEQYQTNALLRNKLAKVLVSGGAKKLAEAIELLRDTKELHPQDSYVRNQLAAALAVSGDADKLKEAIQLLEDTVNNDVTDNKFSRDLLADLTGISPKASREISPVVEAEELEAASDGSLDEIVEIGQGAQKPAPLSQELSNLARMSRLKFRLVHAQGGARTAALNELQQTLEEDPTFAYAQLLAVRQGLWKKESNTLPSFPAAFELALADSDLLALSRLSKQYPRLQALIMVARAMYGDKDSAKRVQEILENAAEGRSGIEKMLREKVGPALRLIEGGKLGLSSLNEVRQQVITALRDVNEWAIGGGDWRIAA
jgi:Tfp pilus assembly protein PilF